MRIAPPSLDLVELRKLSYHPEHDAGGFYEMFYAGGDGVRVLSVHSSREAARAAIPSFLEHNTWALAAFVRTRPENTYCDLFGPDLDLERRRSRLARSSTRCAARQLKRARQERLRLLRCAHTSLETPAGRA